MDITLMTGANATGKSTRLKRFIDDLTEAYGQWTDYEYTFFDHKKDKVITVVIGRQYNTFLVLGSLSKNAAGWVSLDKAVLSSQAQRTDFYKHVINNDPSVTHIVAEGYFNSTSPKMRPTYLRETGFDTINCFFSFYDTQEQFLERTKERSGHDKDIEWAKKCPGWKDNIAFTRAFEKAEKEELDDKQLVQRLDINAPRSFLSDYLIPPF